MRAGDWRTSLGELVDDAREELATLGERLLDRHLRLAVTGLRRSGKTVFTTALVHHLLDGRGLPFFRPVHEGRYLGARALDPAGPPFPLERTLGALSATPPRWPEPTRGLSTLRLELRAENRGYTALLRPFASLQVDIVDYPGEWLLDLPLLEWDYERFVRFSLELARSPARAPLAAAFLHRLDATDPGARADPAVLEPLAAAFTDYLIRARDAGFALLIPGRLVAAGDRPVVPFAPVTGNTRLPGSLAAVMAERFIAYREEHVRPFYESWFARFDRQIVLVDLFDVLNRGRAHFEDVQQALSLVLGNFRYGRGNLLTRLFAPRIERVLFAASKADHVAPNQHANLKQLLELMLREAARRPRLEGVALEVLALAAVRATDVVRTEHAGQILSCVRGRLADGDRETVLFPGEIPAGLPEPGDWREGRFRFRRFAPRRLEAAGPDSHIRLDQAIDYLLGDKL